VIKPFSPAPPAAPRLSEFGDPATLPPGEAPLAELEEALPFSFARPAEALAESITEVGLLRPLLVQREGSRLRLLAGNLRRRALEILGRTTAPAVFLPKAATNALALALADNLGRPMNPAETALVWRRLAETVGPAEAEKLAWFLGLDQAPKLRDQNFQAAALPPRGLQALAEGRLDLAAAARLARWPAADQEAVLGFFETFKPSLSNRRLWLDLLEDLARRESLRPAELLADPNLTNLAAEAENRPAAEAAARNFLFRRRHPLLAELQKKRAARLKALNSPPGARLAVDPNLEDLSFSLTLTFAGLDEFRNLADWLNGLSDQTEFRALLDDRHD
jgi:ParB-like chromosome segregation protein Spo0J